MKGGVIVIEGNIGAGKSTFAKLLAESLGAEYLAEPADGTNPYLADYYKDPGRWAFEMQMFLLTRRFRAQKYAQCKVRHNGGGFVVMDRSYYGDVCFANVQKRLGYFTERDYDTYLCHHTDMKALLEPPAMAIFLNVPSDVCKERIEKRISEREGRKCESGISLDYLDSLGKEISSLANSMEKNTFVRRMPWKADKTPVQIMERCEEVASDIKLIGNNVYDFWTGTDGIGR